MGIIFDFLFRLQIIYRLIDVEFALYLKNKLKKITLSLLLFLFFLFLIYIKNFYITILCISSFLFVPIDTESVNRGLISKLHETGTFGNWNSTVYTVEKILWSIIILHIFFGPLQV
jgi:hypothetical protein